MQGKSIKIQEVSKTFHDAQTGSPVLALDNVTVEIEPGDFLTIIGSSGCGKTTLLRMIAGLEFPSEGQITVNEKLVNAPNEGVGFMFQHSVMLPWLNVLSNVLLPAKVRGYDQKDYTQRALELLNDSGLAGFEKHRPSQLSGGMRQRVAICRTLLLDPDILLMDEPFGALDAMTRDTMNVDLYNLWFTSGKTVVLVTHSITEAVSLGTVTAEMSARPGRIDHMHEFELPITSSLLERTSHPNYQKAVHDLREKFVAT